MTVQSRQRETVTSAVPLGDVLERYRDRTVLVTGDSGFVGSWLSLWLRRSGARVVGMSLPGVPPAPAGVPQIGGGAERHLLDVTDLGQVEEAVSSVDPEVVFHLAAQPLVMSSYEDPVGTFRTNVMGAANLLEALRSSSTVRACVVVTSDKCYAEDQRPRVEGDPLGGNDPYSASKAATEHVVHAYARSFLGERGVGVSTVRTGNIFGGGDWAPARLIPDFVRASGGGDRLELRHPEARRPWQHVLDATSACLRLGAGLIDDPPAWTGPWNVGPRPESSVTVGNMVEALEGAWRKRGGRPAEVEVGEAPTSRYESPVLFIDAGRAHEHLGWRPLLDLTSAVDLTVDWYWGALHQPTFDPESVAMDQIECYERLARGT
ncbi:MAG: CDP-glucose 4,6-dehydratase [Acidimicrobiales bacterium]